MRRSQIVAPRVRARAAFGLALVLALAPALAACSKPRVSRPDPALVLRSVESGDRERTYLFFAPPGLDPGTPHALVLVFHGGGGDATSAARLTRFRALAEREGFLVAFPNAVGGHWNDGRDDDFAESYREGVDDVAFVDAVIADVGRSHAVDAARVYATGISNGGMFVHRLAAERAETIAAIAPVVGGLPEPYAPHVAPARPVSVLVIQGTNDPLVPYEGGFVTRFARGRVVSTDEALRIWTQRNGCDATVARERLPDVDPGDGCLATVETWSGCDGGVSVELLRLDGGGHAWPGGPRYLPERFIGKVCSDVDATQTIWRFFAAHPKAG